MSLPTDDLLVAFHGNPNLKPAGVQINFTPEQAMEWAKCAQDPVYFAANYVQIVTLDHGLQPFKMRKYQVEMVEKIYNNRYTICKLPRQAGKTTAVAAVLLHYLLFTPDYKIAILANKLMQAREIMERIQTAYEYLPKWLQQGVLEWNKTSIKVENGSKIIAAATSSSAIRGQTVNMVYLDEFAHIPFQQQETFFTSVFPVISSGQDSKVIITSTPKGFEMFAKIWNDSKEGNNTYVRVDVNWFDIPGRDEKWKQDMIKNTSERQFAQEFDTQFLGSMDTLIAMSKLQTFSPKRPLTGNDQLKVFEEPERGKMYFICVDCAEGKGLDYSVFVVFDITEMPYKQVAVYRSNTVSPLLFPNYILAAHNAYNKAMVLIETNSTGSQVASILKHDLECEEVLAAATNGRAGQYLCSGFTPNARPGVTMSKAVKRIGCGNLKTMVEQDKVLIVDKQTIDEFTVFVADGDSFSAQDGHNDDIAMCFVQFAWAANQPYFKEHTDSDVRRLIEMENLRRIEDEVTPFGIIYDYNESDGRPEEIRDVSGSDFDRFLME